MTGRRREISADDGQGIFGSTQYDDYYDGVLNETVDKLKALLDMDFKICV